MNSLPNNDYEKFEKKSHMIGIPGAALYQMSNGAYSCQFLLLDRTPIQLMKIYNMTYSDKRFGVNGNV